MDERRPAPDPVRQRPVATCLRAPPCAPPGKWLLTSVALAAASVALRAAGRHTEVKWCAQNGHRPAATQQCDDGTAASPVRTPKHVYLTYWCVALVLIWVPLAQALRLHHTRGTDRAVSVGSYSVATVASLVFIVRVLVMGVPGDAPWTSNVQDLVTHIAVPVLAIVFFTSRCVATPSAREAGIGAACAGVFGLAWLTVALVRWRRTGQWVYAGAANPTSPTGIVSIVATVLAAAGGAAGLMWLKRRLPQSCPA